MQLEDQLVLFAPAGMVCIISQSQSLSRVWRNENQFFALSSQQAVHVTMMCLPFLLAPKISSHSTSVIWISSKYFPRSCKAFILSDTGKYKTWTPGPCTPSVDRVHGPGPWTRSMDRVHQNMDRVHGPPFMDQVHGPPYHGPGPWTPYFYKLRLHYKLRFDDLWWNFVWRLQFRQTMRMFNSTFAFKTHA